jgi:hypothetical protein
VCACAHFDVIRCSAPDAPSDLADETLVLHVLRRQLCLVAQVAERVDDDTCSAARARVSAAAQRVRVCVRACVCVCDPLTALRAHLTEHNVLEKEDAYHEKGDVNDDAEHPHVPLVVVSA